MTCLPFTENMFKGPLPLPLSGYAPFTSYFYVWMTRKHVITSIPDPEAIASARDML